MSLAASLRQKRYRASARVGRRGVIASLAILFFALPLISLCVIAVSGGHAAFPRASILGQSLSETVLLLIGVSILVIAFAVPLAWFVTRFEFPLRRAIEIASVLPLALPTYLAAYAYVSLTDFFGPLQSTLRDLFGVSRLIWFPDLRSLPGACFIMAMTLYPYVYIPARWSFERQSARQIEAARSLGARGAGLFFRIALPLAWPAIMAGLTLALLETLNDIGATQYLGVQSLTVATFTTWTVRDNLAGAAQMALVLLAIVTSLIAFERWSRRKRRYADSSRHAALPDRVRLRGIRGGGMLALCALPFLLGFAAPASLLLQSCIHDLGVNGLRPDVASALGNTLLLAFFATLFILAVGFGLVLLTRLAQNMLPRIAVEAATTGYAVPGLILVVGLMPLAGLVDRSLFALGMIQTALLSGSYLIVIIAYSLRFTAIATGQGGAAMKRLTRNVDHAAVTLGASRMRLVKDILSPQLISVAGAAAILIAVDCIKELPATLVLRPLNVETLSTLVYGAASRGAFEDGAVAAMLIVLVGLAPLTVLFRLTARE